LHGVCNAQQTNQSVGITDWFVIPVPQFSTLSLSLSLSLSDLCHHLLLSLQLFDLLLISVLKPEP
jgi:hypothetical protein